MATYHQTPIWALAEYISGSWVSDTGLPRPGRMTFSSPVTSTHIKKIMVDGSLGRIRPDVTWNNEEIRFAWPTQRNTTLKIRLENYIKSGSPLRITTHENEIFYGRFDRFTPEWILSGETTQKYKMEVTLDVYKQEKLENE